MNQDTPKPQKPPRRKQEDRSRETRQKLLAATRACVARDGYANTTIAKITQEAGLTRGAHLHHYATKEQLIAAATEDAGFHIYTRLGLAMADLADEKDRVRCLVEAIWTQVMQSPEGRVMLEFLNAAQTDASLADHFGASFRKVNDAFRPAASHYFEAFQPGLEPGDVIELIMFQMQGMLLNTPLESQAGSLDKRLSQFVQIMETCLVPKPAPLGAPPRFDEWINDSLAQKPKDST